VQIRDLRRENGALHSDAVRAREAGGWLGEMERLRVSNTELQHEVTILEAECAGLAGRLHRDSAAHRAARAAADDAEALAVALGASRARVAELESALASAQGAGRGRGALVGASDESESESESESDASEDPHAWLEAMRTPHATARAVEDQGEDGASEGDEPQRTPALVAGLELSQTPEARTPRRYGAPADGQRQSGLWDRAVPHPVSKEWVGGSDEDEPEGGARVAEEGAAAATAAAAAAGDASLLVAHGGAEPNRAAALDADAAGGERGDGAEAVLAVEPRSPRPPLPSPGGSPALEAADASGEADAGSAAAGREPSAEPAAAAEGVGEGAGAGAGTERAGVVDESAQEEDAEGRDDGVAAGREGSGSAGAGRAGTRAQEIARLRVRVRSLEAQLRRASGQVLAPALLRGWPRRARAPAPRGG